MSNGRCALTWLTPLTSVCWYDSAYVLEEIHSHGGKTLLIFDDPPFEPAEDDQDAGEKVAKS